MSQKRDPEEEEEERAQEDKAIYLLSVRVQEAKVDAGATCRVEACRYESILHT